MKVQDTYSIDYLIGETDYLGRGLGTSIVLNLVNKIQYNTVAKKCLGNDPVADSDNTSGAFCCFR